MESSWQQKSRGPDLVGSAYGRGRSTGREEGRRKPETAVREMEAEARGRVPDRICRGLRGEAEGKIRCSVLHQTSERERRLQRSERGGRRKDQPAGGLG